MQQFFTSESVSEGHPDKVCDQISDAVVDLFLRADPRSRTAIETLATTNQVVIAGETKCNEYISAEMIEQTVRDTIRRIGYDQKGFSWQTVKIKNYLHHQSCDIALGVDRDGAGDQGIMFGYAKKEKGFDSDYMPLAIYWADRILQNLAQARHSGEIIGIEPDAKSQVTLEYDEDGTPKGIKTIVLSTQHNENLSQEEVRRIACRYVKQTLPAGWMPAGLADECLLQISYAIGLAEPLSLYINTNKTNKTDESKILAFIRNNIDLTPQGIINYLRLRQPIYLPTAAYGHFGRQPGSDGTFSWEKLDLTEQLKSCF